MILDTAYSMCAAQVVLSMETPLRSKHVAKLTVQYSNKDRYIAHIIIG